MTDYPNNIPAKLEIIKASEITPKEVRWLWYPYIPFGKVTLLQGDPGDGKSKLMLSLAALLSKGAPLPLADEDAIGGAIRHIGNIHKYARQEDVPEHTLFVITTDGMENASYRYNSETVRKMIERQKSKYGWEFLFLGANIDAVETAGRFGIDADRAVNYHSDHEGTQLNYEVLSAAVSAVRHSAPLGREWKKRIDEDFQSRKDKRKRD